MKLKHVLHVLAAGLLCCVISTSYVYSEAAVPSIDVSAMKLHYVGLLVFDTNTMQIESFSEGADITILGQKPGEADLRIKAKDWRFHYTPEDPKKISKIVLTGDVEVEYPEMGNIKADKAVLDQAANELTFTGDPIKMSGTRMGDLVCDEIIVTMSTGKVTWKKVRQPDGEE